MNKLGSIAFDNKNFRTRWFASFRYRKKRNIEASFRLRFDIDAIASPQNNFPHIMSQKSFGAVYFAVARGKQMLTPTEGNKSFHFF